MGRGGDERLHEEVGPIPTPTFSLPELRVLPGLCQSTPERWTANLGPLIFLIVLHNIIGGID